VTSQTASVNCRNRKLVVSARTASGEPFHAIAMVLPKLRLRGRGTNTAQ
jgi:hypothetical protein